MSRRIYHITHTPTNPVLQGIEFVALHYYKDYGTRHNTRNFGDDINSWFLPQLFNPEIIESDSICLVGIGTILNDNNAVRVSQFDRKVVFTSGVGYGDYGTLADGTWDFVCVRGPRSSEALGLAPETGICDGAILLSDLYPAKPTSVRDGVVFIPHVNTSWTCGVGLKRICRDLSINYLSPDAPFETFIETIRSASKVITEAMHGAILADAMRTPWVPIEFLYHHKFKWQDWFDSIELPYECLVMQPVFWDKGRTGETPVKAFARDVYRQIKLIRATQSLRRIHREAVPILSADDVLANRKQQLIDRVHYINETYSV
jgi:succinoglycan biosynthesis protein ExoV